jgi:hypothetical protein
VHAIVPWYSIATSPAFEACRVLIPSFHDGGGNLVEGRLRTANTNKQINETVSAIRGILRSRDSWATQSNAIMYGSPLPVSTEVSTGRKYTFFISNTAQQIAAETSPTTSAMQQAKILMVASNVYLLTR